MSQNNDSETTTSSKSRSSSFSFPRFKSIKHSRPESLNHQSDQNSKSSDKKDRNDKRDKKEEPMLSIASRSDPTKTYLVSASTYARYAPYAPKPGKPNPFDLSNLKFGLGNWGGSGSAGVSRSNSVSGSGSASSSSSRNHSVSGGSVDNNSMRSSRKNSVSGGSVNESVVGNSSSSSNSSRNGSLRGSVTGSLKSKFKKLQQPGNDSEILHQEVVNEYPGQNSTNALADPTETNPVFNTNIYSDDDKSFMAPIEYGDNDQFVELTPTWEMIDDVDENYYKPPSRSSSKKSNIPKGESSQKNRKSHKAPKTQTPVENQYIYDDDDESYNYSNEPNHLPPILELQSSENLNRPTRRSSRTSHHHFSTNNSSTIHSSSNFVHQQPNHSSSHHRGTCLDSQQFNPFVKDPPRRVLREVLPSMPVNDNASNYSSSVPNPFYDIRYQQYYQEQMQLHKQKQQQQQNYQGYDQENYYPYQVNKTSINEVSSTSYPNDYSRNKTDSFGGLYSGYNSPRNGSEQSSTFDRSSMSNTLNSSNTFDRSSAYGRSSTFNTANTMSTSNTFNSKNDNLHSGNDPFDGFSLASNVGKFNTCDYSVPNNNGPMPFNQYQYQMFITPNYQQEAQNSVMNSQTAYFAEKPAFPSAY